MCNNEALVRHKDLAINLLFKSRNTSLQRSGSANDPTGT